MTTINCSFNCKHQQDGTCTLESAIVSSKAANTDCVFFDEIIRPSTRSKNENEFLKNQRLY